MSPHPHLSEAGGKKTNHQRGKEELVQDAAKHGELREILCCGGQRQQGTKQQDYSKLANTAYLAVLFHTWNMVCLCFFIFIYTYIFLRHTEH